MDAEPTDNLGGLAGIFLSHAHEDRSFVRRLARDLRAGGIRVWVDEAEMGVGDSLLDKITGAISEMDYLGVVVSRHSARSDWVKREVEIALSGEVAGQDVKVLPLLLRGGQLPEALVGKTYADFTSELTYASSVERLLVRLGVQRFPAKALDRLSELTSSSALLRTAMLELRGDGLTNATGDALLSARIDDFDLSEFLGLAAREVEGRQLFGLALTLVPCIDERAVGHEALDYCLEPGRLQDDQVAAVAQHMRWVTTPSAVLWCHSRLTSRIRSDTYYNSFLNKHVHTVLDGCFDEMTSYLLQPDRGPGGYNVDSFALVLSNTGDTGPFERRWREWIHDGCFDRRRREEEGSERADILYQILNEHWDDPRFGSIVETIQTRVHGLCSSGSNDEVRAGLYHLVAMVDARYRGTDHVLANTVPRVHGLPFEQLELFGELRAALQAVVEYNEDPTGPVRGRRVTECYLKVARADTSGVTGYWQRG